MPGTIILAGIEAASNTDILQGTRLQTVPARGYLSFELQASDANTTNFFTSSIQMPNGDTPMNGTLMPGTATAGLPGIIDERLALRVRFRINQGGHCVFSCVETGDAELSWRITYSPG